MLCHILIGITSPWTIVGNVFGVRHAFCMFKTLVHFEKRYIYYPTQISIRFQWLSKVVAPVDPTPISSMVLYFVHFVLVLNIQSLLHIETTEGKCNPVPYEQLSVICTG